MKEFVEKLIGRLEEIYDRNDKAKKEAYEEQDWERFDLFTDRNEGIYSAISIVNQLAEEYKGKLVSADEVGYMLDCIEMRGDETWMDYYHKALEGLCELRGKDTNVTTNADHIRNMSDEELAELFAKLAWNSEVQTTPLKYLDWLQSEVNGSE